MASVNGQLQPLNATDTMRDYKHASRTFVDNNFELQPRHSNLFHVVFSFTSEAATLFNTIDKLEIPILVKSTDLPQYTIDVQTHNQYNRKVQSHHGMQYQPITAVFHDDVKELIRNLWHTYYTFYNADPTYELNSNSYTPYDKYNERVQQQWGFQRGNKRFFKDIKIYSMHNHRFAEYTLINPIITAFNHDSHAYANPSFMQHSVQFAYETVKYATGFVNEITPRGFGDIHYDVERSDIAPVDSENTAFINGSLQNVSGQESKDLFRGNLIGVIKDAEIVYGSEKQVLTGNVLSDTLSILANNAISGKKLTSNVLVPVTGFGKQLLEDSFVGPDNIVNSVTNFFSGNVIKSQGQNITSNKFSGTSNSTNQSNIGFANTIPKNNGSIASPNTISNTKPVFSTTNTAGTRAQRLSQLQQRLRDPSVPDGEKNNIREQIRLERL
jgi:hypothetical protein